jgi:flagellar hook-associated protein 2
MAGLSSIDGLASNLNTTEIINAMMEAESAHVTLMQEQQTEKTQRLTIYNGISALLLGLKAKASALKSADAFEKYSVTVSDEDYLTAAASSDIEMGSYNISISQLARNHQIASQGFADSDSTTVGTGSIQIQVGDGSETSIAINSSNNTLEGIKKAINNAKAGVTASIINDGTKSNQYRLIITSGKTGEAGVITLTSDLSGGTAPDFETSSFDAPETLKWSSTASSTASLGATAEYTGSSNKTYKFTVQGTGVQTVGSGDIILNWTDGTNSGTLTVSASDTEVALTGTGSDGLSLTFSAGDLVAGNTFQVQTFSPTVQSAQDAIISIGSSDGDASPISIVSSSNTISGLVGGLTLNLKQVTESSGIQIDVTGDTSASRALIEDFINQYNEVVERIGDYLDYNAETEEAGAMLGDSTLMYIEQQLRSQLFTVADGLESGIRSLSDLGIRTSSLGKLTIVNSSALDEALQENLDDVMKLFTNYGSSSSGKITFLGASNATKASTSLGYAVKITQAAAKGYLTGTPVTDPSETPLTISDSNNTIRLKVDGIVSEDIVLTNGTYTSFEDLAEEVQAKIDEDDNIGSLGVNVSYIDTGETGFLKIESSSYGTASSVFIEAGAPNSALVTLGLALGTVTEGVDVAGTINGEPATGVGRLLTGKPDNKTTDGLQLQVDLLDSELLNESEATVYMGKGVASRFDDLLDSLTKGSNGMLARKSSAINAQIDLIKTRIEQETSRLSIRREALVKKFYQLETILSELNAESSTLETQFDQLSSNWKIG